MDSNLNRVQVLVNGKEILSTSIEKKFDSNKDLIIFLEEVVRVLKAPKIPMKEGEIL